MDKGHWFTTLKALCIPDQLADEAADVLARQDTGELPCPLPEGSSELTAVRSAHAWWTANGMPHDTEVNHP